MHYRVRYSLDFDPKIRSGQVCFRESMSVLDQNGRIQALGFLARWRLTSHALYYKIPYCQVHTYLLLCHFGYVYLLQDVQVKNDDEEHCF